MENFRAVFWQAGGILVGLALVLAVSYLFFLVLKESIKNKGWRTFFWVIGELILIIVVFRFILRPTATAVYVDGRDWWIKVPARDVDTTMKNLWKVLTGGASSGSGANFRPLPELPDSPSAPTQQFQPLPTLPSGTSDNSSSNSLSSGTAGTMLGGGNALATCMSDDCPNGQCPQGCRSHYTWWNGGRRYGRMCNATEPAQAGAWIVVEIGSPGWNNGPACPSIR